MSIYGRPLRASAPLSAQEMAFLQRLSRRAVPRPTPLGSRAFARAADEAMAGEPLADMINRANRTDTLLKSRVVRMTPQERQGSLTAIWAQAQDEAMQAAMAERAAAAARADRLSQLGRAGMHPLTAAAAATGGIGAHMAMNQKPEPPDVQEPEPEADLPMPSDDPIGELTAAADGSIVPSLAGQRMNIFGESGIDENNLGIPGPAPLMELEFADDDVFPYEPEIGMEADGEGWSDSAFVDDLLTAAKDLRANEPMAMPSPAEAVALAPGPEMAVSPPDELESLPGPQLRSIKALMRGGIPEGRAMDIILRGSSMSPDEYRMVTGGRR